jgi:serine/threonine protein kinase/tetratricopeptide (TPR) repeat protein
MPDLREQEATLYSDPLAPLRLALRGHYEIERQIGQGAFATVYLAQDLKHERKVAIKVLNADPTSETSELRFIREIRVLARLQHPNILPLHDSGHVEALLYYVMPYVSGETLRERIDRERQLSIVDAACIAKEAADALACAHAQGIVHRDIKPENILLSGGHAIVADFGIARAIDVAGIRSLTRTGIGSPGTPAYMSPEQLLAERDIDSRSDIYSVGCVLYEALSGKPPFAGKEGFVKRFTDAPPVASHARKDVPLWLDAIIEKALARNPADRYTTATELVRALTAGLSTEQATGRQGASSASARAEQPVAHTTPDSKDLSSAGERASGAFDETTPDRTESRLHRVRLVLGFVAGVALLALLFAALPRQWRVALRGDMPLDSTRLALLPITGLQARDPSNAFAGKIYAAFGQWEGLDIVPDEDVRAALGDDVRSPRSRGEAISIAKKVGAGRFVWGRLNGLETGTTRLELYDVAKDKIIRELSIPLDADQAAYTIAARSLLSAPNRPASADGADGQTRSYPAWSSYGLGHVYLHDWNLADAETAFRASLAADPRYTPARAWLAQVLSWRAPFSPREWREEAARALMDSSKLSARERSMATGLIQLGARRYPEACSTYAALTRRDSLDFVGWYGVAQCHSLDSLVVRSPTSPSGWAFRSRYSDAADAYMLALRLDPGAHAIISFDDLKALLPISSTQTRQGRSANGVRFAAYPAMIDDTALFVPYDLSRFANLPARQIVAAKNAALQHNLDVLLDFTTDWTRRSPQRASAFEALADVLEVRGEISEQSVTGRSALTAARRARSLAVNQHERVDAMTREAWLLFKLGAFSSASALADTILAANAHPGIEDGKQLIGLAALTGKVTRTSELAALTNAFTGPGLEVPSQVRDIAASFFARAALGVCDAATVSTERRLDDEIAANVAENEEQALRQAIKSRPLTMLAPCTRAQSTLRVRATTGRLLRMQQAFAQQDSRSLRVLLDSVTMDARTQRPGDVSLDFTYQVAWLRAAAGDTAGATRQLDLALRALSSLSPMSIREVASAAAAGRAMTLRAEIAAARGEKEERQKWSRALAELWKTADPELQPVVSNMRAMAAESYVR